MSGLGRSWYAHGGKGTEFSYKHNPDLVCDHIKFLETAQIYYIDEENRFFSHAGPHPSWRNEEFKYTPESEFYWNREFWHQAYSGKHPGKEWNEVYIGHSPTIRHPSNKEDCTKPLNRANVWNMDTGACFNGKVSMMDIETKELFQSEIVRKLYPDECGRMPVTYNQQAELK
jgi:serine/threonine protein phosphatase 1